MSRTPEAAPAPIEPARRTLAWAVHLLTASGAAVGLAALLETARGDPRSALLWMLVALVIDSVDGTLARRADVERVVPRIDGRRLDDIVDYLNYVIVPVFFLAWSGRIDPLVLAGAPVLASAYGFSQTEAKTEDGYFLGFPSYWNVVALYAFLLDVSAAAPRRLARGALDRRVRAAQVPLPEPDDRVGPRHERRRRRLDPRRRGAAALARAAGPHAPGRGSRCCIRWATSRSRSGSAASRGGAREQRAIPTPPASASALPRRRSRRPGRRAGGAARHAGLAEHARRAPLSARIPVGSAA